MNPIDTLFRRIDPRIAGHRGGRAFIPFLTAGDPDVASTPALARALITGGASLLEIGFPYSDPIADGPVIQASYTRALERGLRLEEMFACARQVADENPTTPLVAMTSFSLVHRRGPEAFIRRARAAGFCGAVVPDLPVEESLPLARLVAGQDFKLIQLVTPTTSKERAMRIVAQSTGFVYCVSVTGITGERAELPAELIDQLRWLRTQTNLPLCVGFGISRPEHVRVLRDHVDGVIVGSAFIRQLETPGTLAQRCERLQTLARSLADALTG